ncbi:MAG: hypothetical protein Q4D31_05590 [Eubacteriales bacterium]|nr:hypothetical protein [Eubacteriales bacterium]
MKKKRIVMIAVAVPAVLLLSVISFLVQTGFHERTDVALLDHSVSADGTKLTFKTIVSGSMGYIRGFADQGGGAKPHRLKFYSTFGGLNSSFGAKHEFALDLAETDTAIHFARPNGGYELVLQKDAETGAWREP